MPFSLFRWAHPSIQPGSFLVKVVGVSVCLLHPLPSRTVQVLESIFVPAEDDTELDTFGMGKSNSDRAGRLLT